MSTSSSSSTPELTPADILAPSDPMPGDKTRISIRLIYSELAAAVAAALPEHTLFLKNGELLTISISADGRSYTETPMSPIRFSTWVEQFVEFRANAHPDAARTSLSEAQSKMILNSDILKAAAAELREVSPVRLPMLATGSSLAAPVFVPAPVGYDPESKIFTVDGLPINWHQLYKRDSVVERLLWIFNDFPFDGGDLPLRHCRSMGAIVAAMLGQFLRHVIDAFPVILFNANQEGTGKTFLARAVLAPVHGRVEVKNFVEDDNEMRKTLNASILAGEPVCFLDDIKSLVSNAINRVVTSTSLSDRLLGGNQLFKMTHKMQFFVTGNMLKTSRDVERRSLPVDMFCEGDATKRPVGKRISEKGILTDVWRGNMLAALWSLVAGWVAAGCPKDPATEARMSSFDSFKIALHITIWAGLMDPFGPRQVNLDTGDAMGEALLEVVTNIATAMTTELTQSFTVEQILEAARAQNKADIITNGARDERKSLGHSMRRLKGRVFIDGIGRRFQIGNKRTSASSLYTFTILDADPNTFAPLNEH
jgi:hypothetical protein